MKYILTLLVLSGFTVCAQNHMPGKVHFGLVYPLSTNGIHAPLDTNNLSISLIAGISSAEQGLSFAGFSNIILHDTKGAQFAGFSNHIGGNVEGAQFAGFLNTVKGEVRGSQFAGFINVAKDVNGSQFAGFINVAKKVKGEQISGFINIADSSDYPIGIINIIKNREKSIGLNYDVDQTAMLTFRSGGKVLYGIIGAGFNFKNKDEIYAFEAGIGLHINFSSQFRVNTEATVKTLECFRDGEYFNTSIRFLPALKIAKFLEIYAGPSINYLNANTDEGKNLHKHNIKSWQNKWSDNFQALYISYTTGIQILF